MEKQSKSSTGRKKAKFSPEFTLKIGTYIMIPKGTYRTYYGSFDVVENIFGQVYDYRIHNKMNLQYMIKTERKNTHGNQFCTFQKAALEEKAIPLGRKQGKVIKVLFGDK